MKIYNVLIHDRHSDPEIISFEDKQAAMDFIMSKAKEYCRHDDDYKEIQITEQMRHDGWLLLIEYSREDDYVHVAETKLEDPIKTELTTINVCPCTAFRDVIGCKHCDFWWDCSAN